MSKYIRLVKGNSYLNTLPGSDGIYLPYYILALKLKDKITEFICSRGDLIASRPDLFTKNIGDYILMDPGQPRNAENCRLLMNYIQYQIENAPLDVSWKITSTKTIGYFWDRVQAYQKTEEERKVPSQTGLPLLNILAKVAGYDSFADFMNREFRLPAPHLKVLIIPFGGDETNPRKGARILEKRFKMLTEDKDLPLTIQIIEGVEDADLRYHLTYLRMQELGKKHDADLVIWGNIYTKLEQQPKIDLHYIILEPLVGYDGNKWKSNPRPFEYSELAGDLPKKLDAVIYWCLGIRGFFQEKYENAVQYFLYIYKELGIVEEEIFFRIGAMYDLMDRGNFAVFYYFKALEAGGLINALNNAKRELDFGFAGLDQGSVWSRAGVGKLKLNGNLIEKEQMNGLDRYKEKNVKLLMFEIVRIQHAMLLKDQGSTVLVKKYLEQAVKFISKSWLETGYRGLFGDAYLELAQLSMTEFQADSDFLPEKITDYLLSAIQLSNKKSVHESASVFFLRHGLESKAIDVINQYHGGDAELLQYYQAKWEEER